MLVVANERAERDDAGADQADLNAGNADRRDMVLMVCGSVCLVVALP